MNKPRLPRMLVTGANGFVMSNCIPVWLKLGYHIVALDSNLTPANVAVWQSLGAISFIHAGLNEEFNYKTLPAVDAVIHGAAVTSSPEFLNITPEAHVIANLQPALSLLEWGKETHVSRVICISSSAVFSSTAGLVLEDQPATPLGTYATAKAAIEAMTATLKLQQGRDVLVVRLGNVYGLGELPTSTRNQLSLIGNLLQSASTHGTISARQSQPDLAMREWTFAPDIANAIHALLETPLLTYPLYNAAAGSLADYEQIARAIERVLPAVQRLPHGMHPHLCRHGVLSNARLVADTGFNNWTTTEIGIRLALEYSL